MTQLTTRKNIGRSYPSLTSDLFNPERWFGSSLLDFDGNLLGSDTWGMVPGANISETDKAYSIELAVPGLEKKDFKVEVQDGVLSISAEREEEKSEEDKNYRRQEFSYHSFSRAFTLPDNLLLDKIEANYTHGILHLTLPKKEVTLSKPSKQIKVG